MLTMETAIPKVALDGACKYTSRTIAHIASAKAATSAGAADFLDLQVGRPQWRLRLQRGAAPQTWRAIRLSRIVNHFAMQLMPKTIAQCASAKHVKISVSKPLPATSEHSIPRLDTRWSTG